MPEGSPEEIQEALAALGLLGLLKTQVRRLRAIEKKSQRKIRRLVLRKVNTLVADVDKIDGDNQGGWVTSVRDEVDRKTAAMIQSMRDATAASLVTDHRMAASRAQRDTTYWMQELRKRLGGRRYTGQFSLDQYLGDHEALIQDYQSRLRYWGVATLRRLRDAIYNDQLVGASWSDARTYLQENLPKGYAKNQWMLDRVARTEVSRAYNGAVVEGLKADDRPSDPVHKMDIAIFDDRTHYDSYLNHGQHVPVSAPFIDVLSGREYQYPPNRANDRSIVVGWKRGYGHPRDYASAQKLGTGPEARPSLGIPGFR